MIWRLLRKNISIGQMGGYALATLIGLTIVLAAIQFYGDVSSALNPDEEASAEGAGIISPDYLVISKRVSLLNTLSGQATTFGADEIERLEQQPWAAAVGAFTAADFSVTAQVNFAGRGLQTFMFMEAIPDDFIDISPESWHFDAGSENKPVIPIILSKDYLALYNFGFAGSRGLPQLSEGTIGQVPIYLQLSGAGLTDVYQARIAGFSSRLNTIAVPYDFMVWANERYAPGQQSEPSRLIVKVNRPGDPAIADYMESQGYEVAGEKLDSGRAQYFLTLLTTIVIAIGGVISALALFILLLSIHLLLQKNRDKISNLLLLGYRPGQVAMGYYRLVGSINLGVLVVAIAAMRVAAGIWQQQLSALSIRGSSPWPAVLAGVGIMAVITLVNFVAISRRVRAAFRG